MARLARPAAALALLLPLASPAPAALAASPRADLFAGYSYRKSGDQGLNGWDAALGVSLSRWIGAEADVRRADVGGRFGMEGGVDGVNVIEAPAEDTVDEEVAVLKEV